MNDTKTVTTLTLQLVRYSHDVRRTLGKLTGGGLIVDTTELPWREYKTTLSCLPLGRYDVIRHPDQVESWVVMSNTPYLNSRFYVTNNGDYAKIGIGLGRYMYCSIDSDSVDCTLVTAHILAEATKGLDRWRLDISYLNPYSRYIANYGYHKPKKETKNVYII